MASLALAEVLDPLAASRTGLLAVSFAKSPSDAYPLAVNVAQGAARYAELEIGKQRVHLAAFAKTLEDAARALTLLRYVAGWRTTQVFTAGRLVANAYGVAEVRLSAIRKWPLRLKTQENGLES